MSAVLRVLLKVASSLLGPVEIRRYIIVLMLVRDETSYGVDICVSSLIVLTWSYNLRVPSYRITDMVIRSITLTLALDSIADVNMRNMDVMIKYSVRQGKARTAARMRMEVWS